MNDEIKNVTVKATANVYFDGKCVSHTVTTGDGERKSVGVILPSQLTFNTGDPERMEVIEGACRVRLAGDNDWREYAKGQSFDVPANSSFEIETRDALHYVCHFG